MGSGRTDHFLDPVLVEPEHTARRNGMPRLTVDAMVRVAISLRVPDRLIALVERVDIRHRLNVRRKRVLPGAAEQTTDELGRNAQVACTGYT